MKILVNASNLKVGGGVQVADSVCRELYKYPKHHFVIVHTNALNTCANEIAHYGNIETVKYESSLDIQTIITGRDKTLDALVKKRGIDAVLTVFGPSRWHPRVSHLSGFAKPQLVLPESPFWKELPFKQWLIYQVRNRMAKFSLGKCADYYFTENPFISERLQLIFPHKNVFTVTNNANQVFLNPEQWDKSIDLPPFEGITLLTVSANYPHKNLPILIRTCHYLEEKLSSFHFRFVLTINENDLQGVDDCAKRHIVFLGPVKISQVPPLYEKSDIMLLPTLLECFSASYAEAMVMRKPILTTDLNFAHGLCANAALYYEPTSHEALGDAIIRLAGDKILQQQLVANGAELLKKYDTFEQRAEKLIKIIERITQ